MKMTDIIQEESFKKPNINEPLNHYTNRPSYLEYLRKISALKEQAQKKSSVSIDDYLCNAGYTLPPKREKKNKK
jgi:hypothetical protein